jgi:YbbR domain-containing protein
MDRMLYGLKALKEYAKDYILQNTGLKILALLITSVLWLSVASRLSQVTLNPVPIEFANLANDLTLSKYDTLSVKIFLRGPKDVIDALRSSDLAVLADLQGIEPGVRVIPLRIDEKRLPASIDPQSIEVVPRSIRVTIERLVEAELLVKPRIEGDVPQGYEIYQVAIIPKTIKVNAPSSHIKDVENVSTESVNVTGKTETFTQQVAIDTGSPNISTGEDSQKVTLTIVIGEARKERLIDKVPVTFLNVPQVIQLQPKYARVLVLGPPSMLDSLTAADVEVTADYAMLKEKSGELKLSVKFLSFPDRLTLRSVEPVGIRVKE